MFRGGLAQRPAWRGADAVPAGAAPADDPPAAISGGFVDGILAHRLHVLVADAAPRRGDAEMMAYMVAVAALGDVLFSGRVVEAFERACASQKHKRRHQQNQGRKRFFFEKKKQKTFVCCGLLHLCCHPPQIKPLLNEASGFATITV